MAPQTLLVLLLITHSYYPVITGATLTTEVPFTSTPSAAPATSPLCAVEDVADLQTAIACGDAEGLDVASGNLTDAKKAALVNFLAFLLTQPLDQLADYSETYALMNAVLMVYTKLTNPAENLSLQEESTILALTEDALKALAETLGTNSCSFASHEGNSINLCKSGSVRQFHGYTFTYQVPVFYDAAGQVISSYEETIEFDLSDLDGVTGEVSVVVLRNGNAKNKIDEVEYYGQASNQSSLNETSFQLNSALLSFTISVQGVRTSTPVAFNLYNTEDVTDTYRRGENTTTHFAKDALCAFVDDADPSDIRWSIFGCEVILEQSAGKYTSCACNHTTNFAVLMQVYSYEVPHPETLALSWITYIGCIVAIIMLVLTLAVFFYLGGILTFDRSFIYGNLTAAILIAHIVFLAGIEKAENIDVCTIVAALLHFLYLSVFAWMLVEGFHLYRKIVKVYGSEDIKMYAIIGWGFPAVITITSFGANNEGYAAGYSCWLDTSSELIGGFVAPVIIVILITLIVLAVVFRTVVKSVYSEQKDKHDHIKAGVKAAILLLPILCLTWLIGLVAVNTPNTRPVFQYVFALLSAFQALLIFLINCVFNSEVREAFVRKREKTKMISARETMEHSMSFMYAANPDAVGVVDDFDVTDRANDNASLASGEQSSRPGSRMSRSGVTPRNDPTGAQSNRPGSRTTLNDVTPLNLAGAQSRRPGSSTALNGVTPRNNLNQGPNMKRPHSGKVSPFPNDLDEL